MACLCTPSCIDLSYTTWPVLALIYTTHLVVKGYFCPCMLHWPFLFCNLYFSLSFYGLCLTVALLSILWTMHYVLGIRLEPSYFFEPSSYMYPSWTMLFYPSFMKHLLLSTLYEPLHFRHPAWTILFYLPLWIISRLCISSWTILFLSILYEPLIFMHPAAVVMILEDEEI